MDVNKSNDIRQEIADGNLKEALNMAHQAVQKDDPVVLDEIVLLVSRFSNLEKRERVGDIYISEAKHERNVITHNLLKILREISGIEDEESTRIQKNANELSVFPKPKPYFTGRDKEILKLENALKENTVVLVDGIGGVGKTQIVARVIEKRKGVVWYNCNDNSELDTLISLCGYGEILVDEGNYSNKIFKFLEVISNEGLLLILDDFHSIATNEVFLTFLKACTDFLANGKIILISRLNVVNEDLVIKRINVKGLAKSRYAFAEAIVQHSFAEEFKNFNVSKEDIIKVCDSLNGHPLGIELALLLISNGEKPIDIAEKLIKNDQSYFSNKILLHRLFKGNNFSSEEIEFLKIVSVFRGNINIEVLRALLPNYIFNKFPPLVRKNILSKNEHYVECHPLIKEFFYNKLEKKEETHLKVAKFLEETAIPVFEHSSFEEPLIYHLVKAGEWESVNKILAEKELESLLRRNQQALLLEKTKEITKLNAELKNANEEIKHFAYTVSHDLKEPLRTVGAFSQLIQREYGDQLDEKGQEYIQFTVSATRRMWVMVDNLLKYLIIGKDEDSIGRIDLNDVIKSICESLKLQIEAKNATIRYKNLPYVYGKFGMYQSLFQNLISNAIKFCDDRKPIVVIESTKNKHSIIITVKDNGVGIPEEFKEQIFSVFTRLHTQEDYEGSGIGLSICKKIVKTIGGKIWVESDLGIGSTFFLEIKTESNTQ